MLLLHYLFGFARFNYLPFTCIALLYVTFNFALEFFKLIKNTQKFGAELSDFIFNPWWRLVVVYTFQNTKFRILSQAFIEHFGG